MRTIPFAPLLLLFASGCMFLEHALTPKIPVSPNLQLSDGTTWASAVPFNISGEWTDGAGGRIRISEEQGFGHAEVLSEGTKFLWDAATLSQINGWVTLERTLGGQTIDRLEGRLGCTAAGDAVSLTIDFGEHGTWLLQVPWKLAGQWHRDGVSIVLKPAGQGRLVVAADPKLGWQDGTVTVDGCKAQIELRGADGLTRRYGADLTVGAAFTLEMIAAANQQQQPH